MQELDDMGLMGEYVRHGSEEAFAALVARHVNKVYSVALRHTRNPSQAEEITQAVFVILAGKCRHLGRRVILSGWLYQTARLTALTYIRSEIRRTHREQEAHMQTTLNDSEFEAWQQIAPLLDEAMSALNDTDRHAILLRYFDGKSMKEVGATLGSGEDAAKMRVNRAVEKLRLFFSKRHVVLSGAVITGAISAHSVQAAPAALAGAATALALAKGATASASTLTVIKGALKIMAWTNAKTAILTVTVVGLATFTVIQHQAQAKLRLANQTLQQQVDTLQAENTRLATPAPQPASSQTLPDDQRRELIRLRGEVGMLRDQTNQLATKLAATRTVPGRPASAVSRQPAAPLPDDYPKTPGDATKGIFDALSRSDWDAFFTNYGEPGVPREMYDKMLTNEAFKSYVSGVQVLSVGEPTNSFGPNMWFVPYTIQFTNGEVKEFQLHVAQDPSSGRWYFKGGI